jgi:hypothetical protein
VTSRTKSPHRRDLGWLYGKKLATPCAHTLSLTVITTAGADASSCAASVRGTNDYVSSARASTDGKRCCVAKIILRANGVPATEPNQ